MRLQGNLLKVSIVLLVVACWMFSACSKDKITAEDEAPVDVLPAPSPADFSITPIDQLNQGSDDINSHADVTDRSSLEMNYRSYVTLGEEALGIAKPNYPRVKQLADGGYIMFVHNNQIGASCDYALSKDLKSWQPQGKIFQNYKITDSKGEANERRFSNCDALVLSNGDVIAVASFRADKGYREKPLDAGIALRRSTDNGRTWSEPVDIYQGVNWEPCLLELPSGEIQCYFTDSDSTVFESAYTGTAMISSMDNGQSWSPTFGTPPYFVMRTAHEKDGKVYYTNQMPAVIQLNNSMELAAALEANAGVYYISFAYSGEDGQWTHLAPDQEGPEDRHDNAFLGSGPALVQFPSGETVVSYNYSSTFYMKIGDASARNFGAAYAPFSGKGFWGTMELIDDHQLIGAIPNGSMGEVMLAKFILNHRIEASNRTVTVDADNDEWEGTDDALFVGAVSQAQATLRASVSADSVYFLVEVLDDFIEAADYVTIYLAPSNESDEITRRQSYRLRLSYDGLKGCDVYNYSWIENDLRANVRAAFRGTPDMNRDQDEGYVVEVGIPRSELTINSNGQLLINLSIKDGDTAEHGIADTKGKSTAKWIPLEGL